MTDRGSGDMKMTATTTGTSNPAQTESTPTIGGLAAVLVPLLVLLALAAVVQVIMNHPPGIKIAVTVVVAGAEMITAVSHHK